MKNSPLLWYVMQNSEMFNRLFIYNTFPSLRREVRGEVNLKPASESINIYGIRPVNVLLLCV
jgi:hypothetical protein